MEKFFEVKLIKETGGDGIAFSGAMIGPSSSIFFEGDRETIAACFASAREDHVAFCAEHGIATDFDTVPEDFFESTPAFGEALDILQDANCPGLESIAFELTLPGSALERRP